MVKLKPGDRVDCCVSKATVVSPYRDHDEIITFEIVAIDKYGYYLYVPPYRLLKNTFKADKYQCRHLDIEPRFTDTDILYIDENLIRSVHSVLDGMKCAKCKEFTPMAESNQENETFICWSCRTNPYR